MLSAPVKSAKRISSLFSLGSNKDASNPPSPRSPSMPKPAPDQVPHDSRPRSSSRPARIVSNPVPNFSQPLSPSTMNMDQFDDSPLPPPPSLLTVNQDLADSAPNSPDLRPQSRGRRLSSSRPSSSAGLGVPGSGTDSRPGTPSKRRSWMPGRARASSMDVRSSPQLPSAWIAGLEHKVPYDLGPLGRGEQVCKDILIILRDYAIVKWCFLSDRPN